jgi:hypothetical protein
MRLGVVAAFLSVALMTPAHAENTFFVVVDAEGYCSVTEPKPSPDSGLTIIADASGYATKEAADTALKASPEGTCKNITK